MCNRESKKESAGEDQPEGVVDSRLVRGRRGIVGVGGEDLSVGGDVRHAELGGRVACGVGAVKKFPG